MKNKPQFIAFLLFATLLLARQGLFAQAQEHRNTKAKTGLFDEGDSDSDYLLAIERAGETLESAYNDAETGNRLLHLSSEMEATRKKLDLILSNLKIGSPNVRNQQMYRTMLQDLEVELEGQNKK
jgi:hypothetical protein